MNRHHVRTSCVLRAKDLNLQSDNDVRAVVSQFLTAAEGVAALWVEYARGVLLFVMAPGDDVSGAFYVYDRHKRNFWIVEPVDGVFGGYSIRDMRRKIRQFQLLKFAENPASLASARA
jgi:hypothetical protein